MDMIKGVLKTLREMLVPVIVANGIRTVALWFAWNQISYLIHHQPISLLTAFGVVVAIDIVVETVNRLRGLV